MSVLNSKSNVLLTGATGLIGGEVLRALIDFGVQKVWVLVRNREARAATDCVILRMRRSGVELNGDARFIDAILGDVRRASLGLLPGVAQRIHREIDFIVHCAGETSFIRESDCMATNVSGMRNLIGFALECMRNPTIVHVGTAASSGVISHASLDENTGCRTEGNHYNEYTRSKALAERLLIESDVPSMVVRPSIVLSAGLPDRKFARTIFWFVPLLQHFKAIPVDPNARLDIVPVDFVARSTVSLMAAPERRWRCYNLSSGPDRATTCQAFSHFLDEYYHRSSPLRLVHPSHWQADTHTKNVSTPHQRKLFGTFRYYLPFINMDVVYDNARLSYEIGIGSMDVPLVTQYAGDLLRLVSMEEAQQQSVDP